MKQPPLTSTIGIKFTMHEAIGPQEIAYLQRITYLAGRHGTQEAGSTSVDICADELTPNASDSIHALSAVKVERPVRSCRACGFSYGKLLSARVNDSGDYLTIVVDVPAADALLALV